jgi:hypothetical protein
MLVRSIKAQDGYRLAPVGYGLGDMLAAVNLLAKHNLASIFGSEDQAKAIAMAHGLEYVTVH